MWVCYCWAKEALWMVMGLRSVLLFCVIVAGVPRRSQENLGPEAACMTECAEHSGLNFPKGSRYSYRYSTATNTFLQGSIYKRSGMSLESTVIIEALGKCQMVLKLQGVRIKTTLASREESLKEMDSLREILAQHPLHFSFHDGKILKICPWQWEQAWVLNIKRGILSVLQTSPAAAGGGTVDEMDILGKCPTKYQRKGSLVLKTKDLNLCSHRYSGFISLQSIALPNVLSQQQILSSKLECAQSFKDGILAEAKCTESSLVTPFSRKGSGAKTQTQSSLKLLQVEAEMLYQTVDSNDLYVSNMLYEREDNERPSTGEEVAELVRKLCLAHSMSFETADLFMTLVFELRSLSADALIGLWRRSSFKCRDNWQPLVDALPSCATEACVVLMKEIIVAKEVEEDKMESFLWSLSFIPEPTTGMIDSLAPLLQSPGASQSVFLGITALVHHFCSANSACDRLPAVQMVTSILEGYLGGNCTLQESGLSQLQLVLKAIGNAGLAATSLTPILSSCASLRSNPTEIRLAAIQAFRRIPCAANRTVLVRLYQAADDDVEIRIASYYIAMKCPSDELFNQVQQTLQEETSSQVGSFVWSHLSQLLETDDPLKQHLRDSLPDDILSREFDWEIWKYSSYSDVTFHSATAGANVEAALVFSPASFIPRSTMTNLTIYTLGRAINLLEFNVRLENAEDLMQKMVGQHSATFSEYLFTNTDERNSKSENPVEAAGKSKQKKLTSKRDSRGHRLVTKGAKPKLRNAKQSCPGGKYNKMSELVKKFTERMGKKKELKCELSIKIFGNELSFLDCEDIKKQVKHYSLNLAELAVKLLKGQEVQFNKRLSLATEELLFPSISGFQVRLALNASAATNVKIKGNVDFKQRSNFFINGYIKPSAFIQISAQMGIVGNLGRAGLNWVTGLRTSTSLDGGIQVKKGQELKVFLNTPEESMEIIDFSSKFYLTTMDGMENIEGFQDQIETKSCTSEEVSKIFGWQLCSEMSYPGKTSGLPFPFSGPAKAAVTLKKQDRGLQLYLMEATYNYTPQEDSWIPSEVVLHFFIGTPKSDLKRDVGVDLNFNVPQKKFRIKFIQPKKKIQVDGKLELSKNSRVGHLELILDDKDVYYIKGMTGLQTGSGEQRYTTQLEVKLIKQGSPIVLSGNITKQLGKKMAFSVSLHNLLKDAAFLSVFLEKKVDDKLRQYSLEGETYFPGILGSHTIGLLQQRGSLWSNALRIKYGLLGDAKNLRHECNAGQKIKVETSSNEAYKLDLGHELHCTQTPSYNHKVHLRHEESESRLYSQLEVNYGKHWDEINNKRKLLISQTFKNSSSPSQVNYFMEFTMQVPEKQVNYRTQLQHSRTSQGRSESSTNFKVQYNDRMPFVAGLQWKDTSRNYLRKWEGELNMDTPWLYLYVAHKLHQPERSAYLSTMELTAGKALSIKNLVVEMFCKDKGNEKEGKIHIYTPTTTYLRAFTVNHLERNVLHSYSEVVSVWNQLVRNEIHLENSEEAKFLCFKIKSTKQEFNLSADYLHLQGPKKTNLSMKALWTDHKSLPVVLQLEGQIEELKKDKMFYQKRGTIHIRHPFKLPIPQSFLLQETFTVDKKQKHYFLETKILINGLDESVQTFTLGYQAEHPYICAGLAHPYNSKIFPQNVELCALTRCHQSAKHEIEAILKVNKKDAVRLLGKYQNKSSETHFRHLLHMDMTHSFQLKFPQALALNGELFSAQTKLEVFDYGVNIKATINRNDSSQFIAQLNGSNTHFGFSSRFTHPYQSKFPQSFQAHAAVKSYGENSVNGSLYLHSSGKDLVLMEVDMSKETRKNSRIIGVSALLHQAILTEPESVQLQLMGKVSPSRLLLSSELKRNENRLHLDFVGAMEQKVGLVLSLNGKVQHNIGGLKVVPQLFSLNGSLKRKNNIHEGNISVMINKALYGLHLRNRNVFGNISLHNITFTLTQNGSQAIPMEAKLKGHLELNKGIKRGLASFQVDEQALYVDVSNVMNQEQKGITGTLIHNVSSLKNAGFPIAGTITAMYNHVIANHTVTIALQSGSERIAAAFGVERLSLESPKSQLTASLKHNITKLKKHGIPFTVEGVCYYQNFSKRIAAGVTTRMEKEHLKVGVEKKSTSSTVEIALSFHHDLGGLLNVVPPVVQVNCNGESTTNQLSGHCNGEVASRLYETPARVSLNGSVVTSNSTANFIGHVSSSDAFVRLHLHATCGLQHSVEIGFKHSLPQLQSLGIAKENQLKMSAVRGDKYKGLLDIVLGQCTFKADGEVRPASNETDIEWTVTLMNTCVTLQKVGLPQTLVTWGSFIVNTCNISLTINLQCDGKTADVQIDSSCGHKHAFQGMLRHSVPQLSDIGLPAENSVLLSAAKGSTVEGILLLQAGECKLKARGDLQTQNKTEWTLETETECQLLQDLNIPVQSQLIGSIQRDGCQAELLCTLKTDGKSAHLKVRTECQPKVTVEIEFRHELPQLKEIPGENKLSIMAEKELKYSIDIELKSGTCELQANGDLQVENKLQWKMLMENKCTTMQELGTPIKIDGSGYILIDRMNLDSQILIIVDESTLQGLLILKATNDKQELDALITQNIQGAIDLGIPARTLVDVTSEKNGDLYKRLIQFSVDGKQITEELSFIRKLDHVSINYKLTHNIEALKALRIEDRIELQATIDLKDSKSFSIKTLYGSCLMVLGGQIQKTEARTDLTGNFQHNWPWLTQLGVSASIQMVVSLQRLNSTQGRRVQIMAGETSVTYTVNSRYVGQQMEIFCQSVHNSEALLTFGYPKVTNLTLVLQKLENKAKTTFEIQYDDKYITLNMDVVTDFELYDTFELMAEVKHSITVLKHLGLPFMIKIAFLKVLTANEIEGSLKLTCEPNTNLSVTITVKNEQQSEELNIKALQNVPFLLQYFPSTAELSSKVNYSMKEAEGGFSIRMEKKDFHLTTKLTFTGTSYRKVIEMMHTVPQLKILPRQLVFMTVYQKSNRTHLLRHIVLWDCKEVKVTGTYTGLFPRLSGGHDIKVEFFHPLSIPFPWHSKVNLYVEHSTHKHQDDITIGWNNKDQVLVSSSLKFGKEHVKYRATVVHPFNFTLRQLEVSSLSERKGGKYNQQIQLTWNGGQPADFKITLEDKSKFNITLWDACVAVSSGQLQKVLTVGSLQACGSIKQATVLFTEYLDLDWDGKKISQNLTYERNRPLYPDKIQLEATLENVFLTSCSKQHMLGKIETDFSTWLDNYMSLALCDLPNVIILSGRHQLNRGDIILQSEGRLHHTGDGREDGVLTVALKNNSTAKVKKYLMEFELKASEEIWLGLTGTATSSAVQSQVLMEGNIDQKEKVKVAASKGKECHQYYMGYVKGDLEEGIELTACTDGQQMATINTYLSVNGIRQERMGQLTLTAVNQSLSLVAHGCGDPVVKVENKLNEIGSHLQAKLMEKIKKFDESVWKFRRSVQKIDFLYEAAGWPLKASQEIAGILQNVGKAVAQMWKQSGIRQTLRNNLPLYLEKIQDTVQQMQNELQKPLATLKDAYYDVTLKPLDEVWQEKTEGYMKKIQAFVPSIVKDVWLMEPIQVTLRAMKTGLDMATHQMLRWAEAKFSRAVSKIRKPLSNLYSFSARNCSMAVKLPMLPKGDHSVDLANITNYLIEEKLMRPLRDLYNINPVAEYYRIKQRMMESPFEYHAVLMGKKHVRTFDGRMYDLTSKCSVLLAKDFVHNTFTVVLNQESSGLRSLHVEMNRTTIDIYPGLKTYKMYNFSLMEENCLSLDQSLEMNGITVRKEANRIEVLNENGISVSCDFHYDLCTVTLDGWHHGVSAGLFGTNDNEAGNEWMLPNHSYTDSVKEFTRSWQVSSHCSYVQKKVKLCSITAKQKVCKVFFQEPHSLLRNCFKVVDPELFYSMCVYDACDSSELKAACNLAAAFVHLCSRNFVPLEIPSQCV
ncbi:uncharacterized protein LOC128844959 [Malaclemys terrapin pileata]|uniref:uncharacterized protein LOC128844959 n=1 Tax=Malaclemys terrapin pileata TaxID=2991368 RepID=UPI0023A90C52|nr:uncharacterized protein LOC128844959 [Malaclemys terrapin pileata]